MIHLLGFLLFVGVAVIAWRVLVPLIGRWDGGRWDGGWYDE